VHARATMQGYAWAARLALVRNRADQSRTYTIPVKHSGGSIIIVREPHHRGGDEHPATESILVDLPYGSGACVPIPDTTRYSLIVQSVPREVCTLAWMQGTRPSPRLGLTTPAWLCPECELHAMRRRHATTHDGSGRCGLRGTRRHSPRAPGVAHIAAISHVHVRVSTRHHSVQFTQGAPSTHPLCASPRSPRRESRGRCS